MKTDNILIENLLNLDNYITTNRKSRRKINKVSGTAEFFTPYSIVKRMCDKVSDEDWADPEKTWLEPGYENGQYDVKDFLKLMEKKEVEKKTGIKKFDICLMNPPYSDYTDTFLDINFVNNVNDIVNKGCYIYPAPRIASAKKNAVKQNESGHLKSIEILDAHEVFNISPPWGYVGIFYFDNTQKFDKIKFIYGENIQEYNPTKSELTKGYHNIFIDDKIIELIKEKRNIYDSLIKQYGTMCDDNNGLIYEENKHRTKPQKGLERVKKYLKNKTYKYCIYKGSFNHSFDKPQIWTGEDPDKLFKGQLCWLTNKENVKNNLIYWLENPFFELLRKYHCNMWKGINGMSYRNFPALPFDKPENEFRKMVDDLNDFTEEEIDAMIKFNVHNADKLKPKK